MNLYLIFPISRRSIRLILLLSYHILSYVFMCFHILYFSYTFLFSLLSAQYLFISFSCTTLCNFYILYSCTVHVLFSYTYIHVLFISYTVFLLYFSYDSHILCFSSYTVVLYFPIFSSCTSHILYFPMIFIYYAFHILYFHILYFHILYFHILYFHILYFHILFIYFIYHIHFVSLILYFLYLYTCHIFFSFIYCTCSYTFFLYFVLSIYCHIQFFVLFIYFHILCNFNYILSSHSSAMLLISCYILYAFHLHILVI